MLSMMLMIKDDAVQNATKQCTKKQGQHARDKVFAMKTQKREAKQNRKNLKSEVGTDGIVQRLHRLIVQEGDIDRGNLPELYQKVFNKPLPLQGKKLTKWLREQAKQSGLFYLIHQNDVLWLTLDSAKLSEIQTSSSVASCCS